MQEITLRSIERASEEAVKLWSLSSAQYPLQNGLIQEHVNATIIEVVSSFALNARRAMEVLPPNVKYPLRVVRWHWEPSTNDQKVSGLWDALSRIIHAQTVFVGFERLPDAASVIDGGAIVIPYIQVETDRKKRAFVDPFSLAYAFLYDVLPALMEARDSRFGKSK